MIQNALEPFIMNMSIGRLLFDVAFRCTWHSHTRVDIGVTMCSGCMISTRWHNISGVRMKATAGNIIVVVIYTFD
jgi:hypothetical protein